MGLAKNITDALFMALIGYAGIVAIILLGINVGPLVFTSTGLLVVFSLGFAYSFYFRL